VPVTAARLADVGIRDAAEAVAGGVEQELLARAAGELLALALRVELLPAGRGARGKRVAGALELREREQRGGAGSLLDRGGKTGAAPGVLDRAARRAAAPVLFRGAGRRDAALVLLRRAGRRDAAPRRVHRRRQRGPEVGELPVEPRDLVAQRPPCRRLVGDPRVDDPGFGTDTGPRAGLLVLGNGHVSHLLARSG
jgi:hypothetical protein